MNYYIIENRIIEFQNELDAELYNYPRLTAEQAEFYEANKCSLQEVLNLQLNEAPILSFEMIKQNKLNEIEENFNKLLELGYYDETEKINLALLEADRRSFTELLGMLSLADSINQTPEALSIADSEGVLREFETLKLKELLFRYGSYYLMVWQTKTAQMNKITAALSEEDFELS